MSGYTPVFASIYDGTLCGKWPTAAVWASLLPLLDAKGELRMSYEAISARTGWPLDLLRKGIEDLMQPDQDSQSNVEQGRRLVLLDPARCWGWRAVNHGLYREKARLMAKNAAATASGADAARKRAVRASTDVRRSPPGSASQTTDTDYKQKNGERVRAPRSRRSDQRLPEDFVLTEERREIAKSERVDADREFAKFRDHWRAASGAQARKNDWDAAWRNWCRKAAEFQRTGAVSVDAKAQREQRDREELQRVMDSRESRGLGGFRDPQPHENAAAYEMQLKLAERDVRPHPAVRNALASVANGAAK